MAFLSKEQILGADDREYREVHVPEWGGTVRVRSLSGKERDKFEASLVRVNKKGQQEQNTENFRAKLVALTVVDEDNKPLFTDRDVEWLGSKSVKALGRIFDVATELNGISEDDQEALVEGFDEESDEPSTSDSLSD